MLTKSFSREEFMDPTTHECQLSAALLAAAQDLRDLIGKPVVVLSGYRSPAHNKAVGGTDGSRHLTGEAFDFTVPGLTLIQMYEAVQKIPAFNNGGIGIYPKENFIHADVRKTKARWARVHGVYVSIDQGIQEYKRLHSVVA